MRGSGQGKWLRKRYTYTYIYIHMYIHNIYMYIYIYVRCTTKVDKEPRYEGRQKETKGDKEPSNPATVTQEF